MIADNKPMTAALEITVISAEGLKNSSFLSACCFPFARRQFRPYATLRTSQNGGAFQGEYRTTTNRERENPRWNQKFQLPMSSNYMYSSSIYLHVYAERSNDTGDRRQLGWCQIPAEDIRSPAPGLVRHLSYRLRDRDGTRGDGIVNVAVKVDGRLNSDASRPIRSDSWRPVIGMALGVPVSGSMTMK